MLLKRDIPSVTQSLLLLAPGCFYVGPAFSSYCVEDIVHVTKEYRSTNLLFLLFSSFSRSFVRLYSQLRLPRRHFMLWLSQYHCERTDHLGTKPVDTHACNRNIWKARTVI